MADLATPTAVLIGEFETQTPEWYGARRLGIGGSDIPAIVGASKWKTPLEVYHDKRGELPPYDAGEAADWGDLLEGIVADEWARREGVHVVPLGTLAHVEHPHHMVNLDRLVVGCADGPCPLEVKTRNAWDAGSWRDDVPDDVLAQVQWQLHVTGYDHAHVAALIGGQRLVSYRVERDQPVIDYLIREADHLWRCVQDGNPPPVDPSALLTDLLDRLHPSREGVTETEPQAVAVIRAEYAAAAKDEKAAKERKEAAKAQAVALLGDADTAAYVDEDGIYVPLLTYKPARKAHVDTDRLKAEHPDAYAACVTAKTTRPILRFKDTR